MQAKNPEPADFLLDIYPGKEADSLTPFLTIKEGLPACE